jgi:hypothetical protein
MNRRYALIALDRHHECADFPGCYLVLLTLIAQWNSGSHGNKAIADWTYTPLREIVERIAEVEFDQAPSGRPMHDDTIAPNAHVDSPQSSALDGPADSQRRAV